MKKIILIGSGGSGKSTLARQISDKLAINVFHLDSLLWKPHWEMTDRAYQIDVQNKLFDHPSWIIDGNYGGTLDMRINEADTIIFLDRNRFLCIYRAIKRYRTYKGKTRPDMQKDCPEKLDLPFLKWIWHYPKKQRIEILKKLQPISDTKKVIILKNNKQIQQFLTTL